MGNELDMCCNKDDLQQLNNLDFIRIKPKLSCTKLIPFEKCASQKMTDTLHLDLDEEGSNRIKVLKKSPRKSILKNSPMKEEVDSSDE